MKFRESAVVKGLKNMNKEKRGHKREGSVFKSSIKDMSSIKEHSLIQEMQLGSHVQKCKTDAIEIDQRSLKV